MTPDDQADRGAAAGLNAGPRVGRSPGLSADSDPGSRDRLSGNIWLNNCAELRRAYAQRAQSVAGYVRFEVVTRELLASLGQPPQRVLDIGGGSGIQAVSLARVGHEVVIVDPDERMLADARTLAAKELGSMRTLVSTVPGRGEDAPALVAGDFDLVCCHSVLMYTSDPSELLGAVAEMARPRGSVSILGLNRHALAMRYGLRGAFRHALTAMQQGTVCTDDEIPVRADYPEDIDDTMRAAGLQSHGWSGVRIFSDHLDDAPYESLGPKLHDLCELEWHARQVDPYRRVARLFHWMGQST